MYRLLLVVTTGNYIILTLGSKVVPVVHSSIPVQWSSPLITDSHIREDLVYNKHSGKLFGFVNLGKSVIIF